jgi:hypothetical protein
VHDGDGDDDGAAERPLPPWRADGDDADGGPLLRRVHDGDACDGELRRLLLPQRELAGDGADVWALPPRRSDARGRG